TVHSREVLERINDAFPDKVCDTTIARTVRFPETTVAGSANLFSGFPRTDAVVTTSLSAFENVDLAFKREIS
ncbi:MAG: hypothetical protein EBZ66_02535, partial [Actinobacteria bacterium]|nr:hypothetical protein [Actinomycetota bacterium]